MTRQVKRYAIISDNWDYVESPTGGFIDRDDYAALDSICVELPFDTYGCMDADKVKEALAATGVPYK